MPNWERHFRSVRRDPDFGTVAGLHTVAELKDLVAAHQYQIDRTEAAFNAKSLELSRGDQTTYQAWIRDWKALKARWSVALAVANNAFNSWRALPDNLAPAEQEYALVVRAVQQSYPELKTTSGDLVDMVGRLTRMGAPPDLSGMPQPRPGTDADLSVLKTADSVVETIKAAKPSNKSLVLIGAGAAIGALLLKKFLFF